MRTLAGQQLHGVDDQLLECITGVRCLYGAGAGQDHRLQMALALLHSAFDLLNEFAVEAARADPVVSVPAR